MTLGEVIRLINAQLKINQREGMNKAYMDYTLAGLIVRGVSVCMGSKKPYPSFEEAYEFLLTDEYKERKEQREQELQVARFTAFANNFNRSYEGNE